MTNRETPNSNSYLIPEDYILLTHDAKEIWRELPNGMRSILLKGIHSAPNSYINSGNIFYKNKSNKHKPVRPLS